MPSHNDGHLDAERRSLGSILGYAWERSRGSISLTLVGVCTAMLLAVGLTSRCGFVSREELVGFLGLSYVGIFHRLWIHQFLTAPLMHGGVTHLLFNMLALWMLGPAVEKKLGRSSYVVFSLVCATCSMMGFLLFNWGTGNIVVGYSGVIFGILAAQAVFFPENVIYFFAFFPLKMKHAVLLLGAVELYLTISPEEGGIAHAAHLFGTLAAVAYLRVVNWQAEPKEVMVEASKQPAKRKAIRQKRRKDIPREL